MPENEEFAMFCKTCMNSNNPIVCIPCKNYQSYKGRGEKDERKKDRETEGQSDSKE